MADFEPIILTIPQPIPATMSQPRPETTDYDSPWKSFIELHFHDFLLFFFPQIAADIDWSKPIRFLDKLEWTARPEAEVPDPIQGKLAKFKTLAPNLKQTFAHPEAARTSNAVDRMMNYQDRRLYAMQYFHGTKHSAQQELRSMAILWNFHLYIPKVRKRAPDAKTPFEALNGFCYHDHWLRNLLIAASLNGRNTGKFISHKVG